MTSLVNEQGQPLTGLDADAEGSTYCPLAIDS